MFGAIKELSKRVNAFNQNKAMKEIMSDPILEAQIIDLNQKQLYEQGIQADGTPTGQYAPATINFWKPLAASEGRDGRTDHVTFKDTGETYDSMEVVANHEGIVITANNPDNVFEKMEADKALGLTKASRGEILPQIKQDFMTAFKKQVFKK